MHIITDSKEITPQLIEKILRKNKSLEQIEVKGIEKEDKDAYTSKICFIRVKYSDVSPKHAPKKLVLKMLRKEFGFPLLGKREVKFYNSIIDYEGILPIIKCYDAQFDEQTECSHLLLQDISDTHFELDYPLPPSYVNSVKFVEALVKLHSHWWEKERLHEFMRESFWDFWGEDFDFKKKIKDLQDVIEKFLDFMGDRLSDQRRTILRDSIEYAIKYRWKCSRTNKHLTLCLRDSHASNAFYPKDKTGNVLLGDWQNIFVFRGVSDLSHFMVVHWFPEQRKRFETKLLRKYYEKLIESGITNYPWEECYDDYRASIILHLYVLIEWQWSTVKMPAIVWLPNIERTLCAFEDLNCIELVKKEEKTLV